MTRPEDFFSSPLNDFVFHGMTALGHEVTDWPKLWYMYKDGRCDKKSPYKEVKELYALGFGYSRTVDDNHNISRNLLDLIKKVENKYFDLIILGTVCYNALVKSDLEDYIFKHYSKTEIIILSYKTDLREDWDNYLMDKGTFFRQVMDKEEPNVYPIPLAFHKEKILGFKKIKKEKLLADVHVGKAGQPANKTFTDETEYYLEYAKSYFGISWKKDHWDVLRPYEIIASGALPYIIDLHDCPETMCITLPKLDLLYLKELIEKNTMEWFLTNEGQIEYWKLQEKIFSHFIKNCTTEVLANYVLKTHKNATQSINS
jgi:hypothetical protein